MPQTENQSELTAEQLKELKREKTRKNIRIIGFGLAIYYFISAGISWYEDSQLKKTQLVSTDETVLTEAQFNEAYQKSAKIWHTDEPKAESGGTNTTFRRRDGVKTDCSFEDSKLEKSCFKLSYAKTLSKEQIAELCSWLGAVENTSDSEKIKKLTVRLGLDEQSDQQFFTEGTLNTERLNYSVSFTDQGQKELSICAQTEVFRR
ncbi:MAG: hypothetical protein J6M93_01050 [Succinivibrio sp.]|nr:hypothetical protein [Succinivibrio sp.]